MALGFVAELALQSGDVDRAATLYGELNDRATRTERCDRSRADELFSRSDRGAAA